MWHIKKRQEQNKRDEGKILQKTSTAASATALSIIAWSAQYWRWEWESEREKVRVHQWLIRLIIAGIQVLWPSDCLTVNPDNAVADLANRFQTRWRGKWSHQSPNWDLRHRVLEVMDTSTTHTGVFVSPAGFFHLEGHRGRCGWAAHKVSHDTSPPACTLTRLQLNMLHILSVSVLHAQDACDVDVTGGAYMAHRAEAKWLTRICSHDICVTGGIPPSQPTLSRKAQAFGLIGQLLSVKTGIVDRPHPPHPTPHPQSGIRGLVNHFWH